MHDRIVAPLGLTQSDARIDPGSGPATATTSTYLTGTGIGPINHDRLLDDGSTYRSFLGAAGALVSTSPALAKIGEAILSGRNSPLHESVATQLASAPRADNDNYGFGLVHQDFQTTAGRTVPVRWHNGSFITTESMLAYLPEQDATIAILSNGGPPSGQTHGLTRRLIEHLAPGAVPTRE